MPTVSFTTSGALGKSALRLANERLVLDSIRRAPGISRAEIARRTDFPPTSVTFVVNRLIERGLIREEKIGGGQQAGRPPAALHLAARAMLAVGVEISRPLSRIVLTDLNGETLQSRTLAWRGGPARFLEEIQLAVQSVAGRRARRILGVGVSVPGTIEKSSGRVVGAESLGWFDVPAGEILRAGLQWPVFFDNNANLCALAEQWYGDPEREALRYFVYVHAQGGLGTGVVADGRILHGVASSGAEFGHVTLYPDGRPCNCGNRGCWEQYASDSALVRAYQELGGETGGPGRTFQDSLEIVRRSRAGDRRAVAALRGACASLGLGFANLVAAFNPQAIILGEPFASAWDLVEEAVRAEMRRRTPAYLLGDLRLLPSRTGPDAALRGAAAAVLAHYFTQFEQAREDLPTRRVSVEALH